MSRDSAAPRSVGQFGIRGTCFVASMRQITAARTGLGPVGGRHTACACYLGHRTRSVRATGLGAGSNSSALPKKGWATLGRFCAADILTPAYG
jgi:hypothetical protein